MAEDDSLVDALNPAERELVDSVAVGETLDLSERPDAERRIGAHLIYQLCVDGPWPVHAKGVRLTGAFVDEPLDFEHATLRAPLMLEACRLGGAVSFRSATASALSFAGSVFAEPLSVSNARIIDNFNLAKARLTGKDTDGDALLADGLHLGGNAILSGGFEAAGTILLLGARINGVLAMSGAKLAGTNSGYALVGQKLHVAGGALMRDGFEAAGAVLLRGASIEGTIDMSGARLTGTNTDGVALLADGLRVAGDALLRHGFEAAGAVQLRGAQIGGGLDMVGAKLAGANNDGDTLLADGLQVTGHALLRDGFQTAGAICLSRARVEGALSMGGAKLTGVNHDGRAIVAVGLCVGGDAYLRDGFEAAGAVQLLGAQIGGDLVLSKAKLAGAVDLENANINGKLDMREAKLTGKDAAGDSVSATRLHVGGAAKLGNGFEAVGGVMLMDAQIDGQLYMGGAKLTGTGSADSALCAQNLRVGGGAFLGLEAAGPIFLRGAQIGGLDMIGAKLAGANNDGDTLLADGLQVTGHALLRDGFQTAGAIRISGARVDGALSMAGAKLTGVNNDGRAIVADSLRVGGDAYLGDGLEAAGALLLSGAEIGGNLELDGARLTGVDSDGDAIVAHGLHVAGVACRCQGLETIGDIDLGGARIDGRLDLRGVRLAGTLDLESARIGGMLDMGAAKMTGIGNDGFAVFAERLQVTGSARFTDGFEAAGAIFLRSARIDGELVMTKTKLTGTAYGYSFIADRLSVNADVLLSGGFEVAGAVSLAGARVDGDLHLSGAKLTGTDGDGDTLFAFGLHVTGDVLLGSGFEAAGAIDLTSAQIDGLLSFIGAEPMHRLDLRGASCARLIDDERSWPPQGALALRGFQFGAVTPAVTLTSRLDWVRRQGFIDWSPDPYERLAAYLSSIGDEAAARRVRVALHDDELTHLKTTRKPGSLTYRLWRRPLGWLVGYGYRRQRAGWLLVAVLLAAGLIFRWAEAEGAMVPSKPAEQAGGQPEPCGEAYPCFNSLVYGADVVLPIIDFGQDSAWRPVQTPGPGALWIWARWAFIAVGWALATVFVAAFTGLVHRA